MEEKVISRVESPVNRHTLATCRMMLSHERVTGSMVQTMLNWIVEDTEDLLKGQKDGRYGDQKDFWATEEEISAFNSLIACFFE